eukprot:5235740-Pyramimonas_sp.AAC.1
MLEPRLRGSRSRVCTWSSCGSAWPARDSMVLLTCSRKGMNCCSWRTSRRDDRQFHCRQAGGAGSPLITCTR